MSGKDHDEPQDGVEALQVLLQDEPTLVVHPDSDYGKLFEFQFTPCCIPLPVLAWFNSVSRGVFLRIIFPSMGAAVDRTCLLETLNALNYDVPVGSFAVDLTTGEVRFKNTVFVGGLDLDVQLLGNLIVSSFEVVRVCHNEIIGAVTGRAHTH